MPQIPFLTDMKVDAFGLENFGSLFRQRFIRASQRPDVKYLFFCQGSHLLALDRDSFLVQNSADGYVLDRLPPETVNDLRDGSAALVVDISGEGEPFYPRAFDSIHQWADKNQISLSQIALMSQNRLLESHYLSYYRSQPRISILVFDWMISTFATLLAATESSFKSRFGFEKDVTATGTVSEIFLCMNATPRPLRIATLAALLQAGLLDKTRWSLMKGAAGKGAERPEKIVEFLEIIRRTDLLKFVDTIQSMEPKIIGKRPIINSNELAFDIDQDAYISTKFSIVTETEFTELQIIRVTEKSIKPLAMGHPFVIFGNPKSLEIIRNFGFQTFDGILNESYDNLEMPSERFESLMDQVKKISRMDQDGFTKFGEITRYNLVHARSGAFMRTYRDVVEKPLVNKLELLSGE